MKKYIIFGFLVVLFSSCQDEETLKPSIIDVSQPIMSDLDVWIRENYTTPYNIEIKYKWDDSELENDKVLVPTKLDQVKPFLESMLATWINPYKEEAGEDFVKAYIPKLMVLVGSFNFNNDGTITQGQAESGKKVTIYELNYFSATDLARVKRMFHIMHHEFAHILHQTVVYPAEYKSLTPEGYTSTWFNFSDAEANEEGFITNYAKLDPNEDFVEMIATMLTNSKDEWDAIVDGIQSDTARDIIRIKESYVVNYFSQIWGIDIYSLQSKINKAMIEGANS